MTTFTTQDRQDAQRTPLTDEQIRQIGKAIPLVQFCSEFVSEVDEERKIHISKFMTKVFEQEAFEFARAIERAHGIGE